MGAVSVQLSVVSTVKPGLLSHSPTVMLLGQLTITGGVLSTTFTVCVQLAELPQSSVAVQVRVTVYVPAHAPGVVTSANVTVRVGSHASVAVGAGNTGLAGHWIGEVAVGQLITGGVVSITTTVWLHDAELPLQSVAVQVRVRL